MNGISAIAAAPVVTPGAQELEVKQTFQKFAAGTFYKEMMKALRKGQEKPAYFHGGMAEDMFQQQLDEQVTDSLAESQGSEFAAPLFEQFSRK